MHINKKEYYICHRNIKRNTMKNFKIGDRFLFQGTKDEAKAYQKLFFDVERTEIQQINHASVNDINIEFNYEHSDLLVLTLYTDQSHAVIALKNDQWYLTDDDFMDSELIDEETLMNIPAFKEAAICHQCDNTGYFISTNGNDPHDRGTPTECECEDVITEIQKYFK